MKQLKLLVLTWLFTCSPLYAEKFRVLVWNIKKSSTPKWARDFRSLAQNTDYALIQEGVDSSLTLQAFADQFQHQRFYESWRNNEKATGLINAGHVKPHYIKKYVSHFKEPVFKTPKLISVEKIFLAKKQELMLINIHALNFRSLIAYKKQLSSIEQELKHHRGPILFAGDFNTWSGERKRFLDSFCARFQLVEVPMERRELFLQLDHVYTRGFDKVQAFQINNRSSSDHFPITVELEY